ncbi:Plant UBX domain-containing protein 7 [Capsicum baccatum]|uniref:Plant UBX domain-containing protein 7 n=1 Tax=Capsicum baccatum TaxID=33114 RepID=A0A2G2XK72_CAPBA|nr:Plant UBX domain-containing protein 7 [Capsicum baccatum]
MANVLSDEQQMLVSSFLEIVVDETAGTARQFLQATNWNLQEAIQRFYNGINNNAVLYNGSSSVYHDEEMLDSEEEEQISSSTNGTRHDNLDFMDRPSSELLYDGPFEYAKDAGKARNKWLLVNVQSRKEFSSAMLNRDSWANEIVVEAIKNSFIFWQEDEDTEEGKKVGNYYRLHSLPAILLIDPITGQNMRSWNGIVEPQKLLEDAMFFMDTSPSEYHAHLIQKQRERMN